jgi:hybrid cluster-associated redox disulfide protein
MKTGARYDPLPCHLLSTSVYRLARIYLCAGAKSRLLFSPILQAEEIVVEHVLTRNLTVAETLHRWPQTATVFLRRRMACVGCAIAPFETLDDVSEIYQVNPNQFLQELRMAAQDPGASTLYE